MDPHASQSVSVTGPALGSGVGAVILAHGRNAAPANILELAGHLNRPAWTYLAPAAAGHAWYPFSFMADKASNEPGLTSALGVIGRLVDEAGAAGVAPRHVVLMGFSQGACLVAEFAARHSQRYGGVVVFSGGVVGPPGTTWPETGAFDGTPVFFGCSDEDSHVPLSRVDESAAVFERMGASVNKRIYPGMGHLVNEEELAFAREILDRAARSTP